MSKYLLIVCLVITSAQFASAEKDKNDDESQIAHGPKEGVAPKVVHMNEISHEWIPNGEIPRETPFGFEISKEHTRQLKGTPTSGGSSSSGGGGSTGVASASVGASFDATVQDGWIPYDAVIAVGPTHIIVVSNSQFEIYKKDHTFVMNTQFTALPYGDGFDPKCFYDPSGHFVMLIDQQSGSTAHMEVGVSQTSDPTGLWSWYQLDWTLDGSTVTKNWGDYPSLGYDNNAVYIGANQYSFSNSYKYSKVRVLSKAELFASTPGTLHWTDFTNLKNADGSSAFVPKAGRMLSSSNSEYLINTRPGGGSSVTVWRIDNGGNAGKTTTPPTLTRVATTSIASYTVPPNGRQPGGSSIETNDCRTQDVVMQNGVLYTAFTEGYSSGGSKGDGIRYLQISTAGAKQKDIKFFKTGVDWYYPVVTVDASNNVFMAYNNSSATQYASMSYTMATPSELAAATPAFEGSTLIKAGGANINYGRWGDYSGIANDPSDGGAIWMYCGYAKAANVWGSWIAAASRGTPPAKQLAPIADAAAGFDLGSSYPNPFSTSTTITYSFAQTTTARVAVYDAIGRVVKVLADGELPAGEHQVAFLRDNLPAGVYYCRLDANGQSLTRKLFIMK